MPVMDGWKFAAEFNARHDHSAPIVVITAAANAKQRAEDIQATNWLGKPFKLEDILAIVSKYVHKSQPAA
jgi:CheY-like chemotaxis protein